MSTENEMIEAEEAAELEAFEAGFNATDIEPVASENTTEPIEESAQEEQQAVPAETQSATPDVAAMIERIRDEERAERQRLHDRVFGTIGELKQKINNIKSSANLSPRAKERLAAEFPELAEMLFDATDTEQEPQPVQQQQQTQTQQQATPAEDYGKFIERRLLTKDHPDWEQVAQSPEFNAWKLAQPAEVAQALDTTWDSVYLSGKLTEFKQWKQAQAQKQQQSAKKQNRLEAAVIPQGVPRASGPAGDDDDEESMMLKSFNKRY